MSTYRVPKCGRHFVKFDDVTIYPVLVVARTVEVVNRGEEKVRVHMNVVPRSTENTNGETEN